MKSLLVRFINVAVIAIAIVGYNGILTNREKTDEIAKLDAQLESEKLAKIDYIEIVDSLSLKPVDKIEKSVLVALAVYIGKTRLIDNFIFEV